MSPELAAYIDGLPIKTYLLTSDTLVIGRVVENRVESVEVKSLCSIETFYGDDERTMTQVILPIIPANFDQSSTISRSHIVIETPASLLLKKSYCDALLQAKVQTVELTTAQQQTNNEPKIYKPKGTSNQYKDRWIE